MDRITVLFWTVICVLLSASTFYGFSAARQGSQMHQAEGTIESGDLVRLIKVLDGDTLQAAKDGEEPVTIRLVGIKSFETKIEKDALSPYAQASVDWLRQRLTDKALRVLLNTATPKDRNGRYLATLYVEDEDVALQLIRQGLVLVYTVYPIPAMPIYLQQQSQARTAKAGVWSSRQASERAQALIDAWHHQHS